MKALLALLALAAACADPALPPGVERAAKGGQAFSWSAAPRRLAYVEGRFPDRTYLVVRDRARGAVLRRRLKGFVLGAGSALSRDGRRVLLDAGKIGLASRAEPSARVVLEVDAEDGRILSEWPIASRAVALGHPSWSAGPVAAWNGPNGIVWRSFGAGGGGGVLKGLAAWKALLFDSPRLLASEKQTRRPRMTVYDMRSGEAVHEWRVALTGAPLALRPDGSALSARWMSESARFVLEAGDPRTGRRVPLLESDGEIETAVETEKGLYAVAKDPSRRNGTGKDFLAPRVLLVVEKDGARWSAPWTSHEGVFFGADGGTLLFAVTDGDRPGAWAIEPTRAALAAAGPAIDGN